MRYTARKFARAVNDALSRDPALADEIRELTNKGEIATRAEKLAAEFEPVSDHPGALSARAYAYSVVRPVLNVRRNTLSVAQPDAASAIWVERLARARDHVFRAIDATGRIELKGSGNGNIAGTGFMVRDDVIATNQHVAAEFAEPNGKGEFVFILNVGGSRIRAAIDFREEFGSRESLEFRIEAVLHMEMDLDPDVAFLRVTPKDRARPLPPPLELFTGKIRPNHQFVAAVGYPQRASRDEETTEIINRTFGNVFDKKRVSPGLLRAIEDGLVVHDCAVLTGNSGSPIICLKTGKVVGIHAEGEFLQKQFAVPGAAVEAALTSALARMDEGAPASDAGGAPRTASARAVAKRAKRSRRFATVAPGARKG